MPCEGCDLETTGPLWSYIPGKHKTAHHGHERVILLGPKAKEIVQANLKADLQAHVFSPADAERRRRDPAPARDRRLPPGTSPPPYGERSIPMRRSAGSPDLWELPAADCGLEEGRVYHYWFEVVDTNVYRADHPVLRRTDPAAYAVDWRAPTAVSDLTDLVRACHRAGIRFLYDAVMPFSNRGTAPAR